MAEGNPIKYSDLVVDDGAIDRLLKAIDTLEKRFLSAQKKFRAEIEKTKKATEESTDATEDQDDQLEKLEKQLEKLIKANKELQDTDGKLAEQKKKAIKLAKDEEKLRKKLIELTDDQAVANEELKLEIQQQRKVVKEQAKANKGLTGEYDKQSKQLNELRKKYKNLAVAGRENTDEAKKLLTQVTALDEKLKAVDKSVGQTQRSVGNYKEQVKEAIEETGVFTESMVGAIDTSGALGGIMAKLQQIILLMSKAQKLAGTETKETTAQTVAQDVATKKLTITQRLFRKATLGSAKAMKVLKFALVSSGISFVILLLGTLLASLAKTQAGLNGLEGVMRALGAILEVIVGRLITFGSAIGSTFSVIIDTFVKLGLKIENVGLGIKKTLVEIKNFFGDYESQLKNINKQIDENDKQIVKLNKDIAKDGAEAMDLFSKSVNSLADALKIAVADAMKLAEMINNNKLANALLTQEMEKQLAISEKAEEIEGDATRTFGERTRAILKSIDAQQKASKIGVQIAQNNLDIVNAELAIIEKNRPLLIDEKLQRIEAERAVFEAKKEFDIKATQLQKVRRQLNQDEIEKNLDILIDGFDNQKTVNERIIANDKKRFAEREKMLNETIKLQKKILKQEVAEIQKVAKQRININDLIATSDSKLLNDKIRAIGLSEILEGRLLEVVREARTQESELNETLIDLDLERVALKKEINQQLEDLTAQNIQAEKERSIELQRIEEKRAIAEIQERLKVYNFQDVEFGKLQNQITEIKRKGIEDRETIEIEALERENERNQKVLELKLLGEEKTQEEINEELTKLKIQQLTKEIELEKDAGRDAIDKELELAKLKGQIRIDQEKKTADAIREIQDVTANALFDSFQANLDKQVNELDRLEDKQKGIVDRQIERAQQGLENNLAFEEQQLAELEQKKIKAQKKQIQLDKIRALYNAYSSASASGEKNAIAKVFRDFAILQGLESAVMSFGAGTGEKGDVKDVLDANSNGSKNGNSIQNGVVRGESHGKRGFGIPVLVEGNEGIWKGSTMAKFGKENFMALTKAIDTGTIGSNFMQPQVNAIQIQQQNGVDSRLLNEMKATRQAIENKPEQIVDVEKVTRGVMDFIDTRKSATKRIVNRHRITKKRF